MQWNIPILTLLPNIWNRYNGPCHPIFQAGAQSFKQFGPINHVLLIAWTTLYLAITKSGPVSLLLVILPLLLMDARTQGTTLWTHTYSQSFRQTCLPVYSHWYMWEAIIWCCCIMTPVYFAFGSLEPTTHKSKYMASSQLFTEEGLGCYVKANLSVTLC